MLKVGRWKLTEAATRIHAAQPRPPFHNNLPLQQQQNLPATAGIVMAAGQNGEPTTTMAAATHRHYNNVPPPPPPPPAPVPTTSTPTIQQGAHPPPPLQIMVHDENQAIVLRP